MNQETINIALAVLVLMLYSKWILFVTLYLFQVIYGIYKPRKDKLLFKIIAVPSRAIRLFLRGGEERFVIYNISRIPSVHFRKFLYRGLGAQIGRNATVYFKTEIRAAYYLKIGRGSIIGDNALLDARYNLTIGNNVNLSSNVSIYTGQHNHRDPYFASCSKIEGRKMSVEIDDRAWLGSNCIILPGVHIGEGAVCCAGSVVTKDVEPYAVVAGIPAKKVNERPRVLKYEMKGRNCRFY